jgi:hypothetical protein
MKSQIASLKLNGFNTLQISKRIGCDEATVYNIWCEIQNAKRGVKNEN